MAPADRLELVTIDQSRRSDRGQKALQVKVNNAKHTQCSGLTGYEMTILLLLASRCSEWAPENML